MKHIIIPIGKLLFIIIVGPVWLMLYVVLFLWNLRRPNLAFFRTGNTIGHTNNYGRIDYSDEYYENPYTFLFGKPIYKKLRELIPIWPWDYE